MIGMREPHKVYFASTAKIGLDRRTAMFRLKEDDSPLFAVRLGVKSRSFAIWVAFGLLFWDCVAFECPKHWAEFVLRDLVIFLAH